MSVDYIKLVIENLIKVSDDSNMTRSHCSSILKRLDLANDSHVMVSSEKRENRDQSKQRGKEIWHLLKFVLGHEIRTCIVSPGAHIYHAGAIFNVVRNVRCISCQIANDADKGDLNRIEVNSSQYWIYGKAHSQTLY